MSLRHFIKHLSASTYRRIILPAPSQSPLSLSYFRCGIKLPTCCVASSLPRNRIFSASAQAEPSSSSSVSSSYLSVRIRCARDAADMLSEALLSFGASSASIDEEDVQDSPEISITSIYPPDENVGESISRASDSVGLNELPRYEMEVLELELERESWIKKTQESFVPVEVCDGIWIVPEWLAPLDALATNIILNPGLAFGTGEHPTTKLCLTLLHSLIKGGERILDYGTGSGILAIAALKLGAISAIGVDIDPDAISSAEYNAFLNNMEPEKLELRLVPSEACSLLGQSEIGKYDVVVANILLNPLLALADHIVSHAKPGGTVALSGILCEQVADIKSRYSSLLEDLSTAEMDDWACISGRRKMDLKFD